MLNLEPRTLVLDIETAPIIAYVWGLKDQFIALNQIKQDWAIIAWGAKWLNEPASKIMYEDQRGHRNPYDDKGLLKHLWKLLDQADIVITQNGQSFDGPKINARFILNGMTPPSPYKHLDTYRIARQVFEFTSNKLEYLTHSLCSEHKKVLHGQFPGMKLWTECLNGNLAAWKEMQRYNIKDVLSTEELYNTIKAWKPARMPDTHSIPVNSPKCGTCGAFALQKRGVAIAKQKSYQRYQCKSCGHWSTGEKI
jgi:DNA polymerase elongation subunit (family B)